MLCLGPLCGPLLSTSTLGSVNHPLQAAPMGCCWGRGIQCHLVVGLCESLLGPALL